MTTITPYKNKEVALIKFENLHNAGWKDISIWTFKKCYYLTASCPITHKKYVFGEYDEIKEFKISWI